MQTRQAAHQVFGLKSAEPLLEERNRFNLPPYTRMVEMRTGKAAELAKVLSSAGFSPMAMPDAVRVCIARDKRLAEEKKKLRKTVEAFRSNFKTDVVLDVDPV